ncbi:MAG: hypothetical protein V9E87_11715 [Gemmatimonadales bacterium]
MCSAQAARLAWPPCPTSATSVAPARHAAMTAGSGTCTAQTRSAARATAASVHSAPAATYAASGQ